MTRESYWEVDETTVDIDEMQFGFMVGCGTTDFYLQFGFMLGCGTTNFYFETVTGEIFSKKEEFAFCICRFGESFWSIV